MASERTPTKLYIPHPNQPELSICGVLEQHAPEADTKGRKLALVRPGANVFASVDQGITTLLTLDIVCFVANGGTSGWLKFADLCQLPRTRSRAIIRDLVLFWWICIENFANRFCMGQWGESSADLLC